MIFLFQKCTSRKKVKNIGGRRCKIGADFFEIHENFPRNNTTHKNTQPSPPLVLYQRASAQRREIQLAARRRRTTAPAQVVGLHQSADGPGLCPLGFIFSVVPFCRNSVHRSTWRQNKARAAWRCHCARARVAVLPALPLLFFPLVQPAPVKILTVAANGLRAMMAAKATGATTLIIIIIINIIISSSSSR